ncbi:hypothetical protein AAG570_006579 [Ranatra chinensis]|uniref:Uncharacterized protein n=1 Tax=Ranatra chinensis TaxID=642074 RepID=A0ABD0Z758_9HEMI
MASKFQNIFYQNKKQETAEIGFENRKILRASLAVKSVVDLLREMTSSPSLFSCTPLQGLVSYVSSTVVRKCANERVLKYPNTGLSRMSLFSKYSQLQKPLDQLDGTCKEKGPFGPDHFSKTFRGGQSDAMAKKQGGEKQTAGGPAPSNIPWQYAL